MTSKLFFINNTELENVFAQTDRERRELSKDLWEVNCSHQLLGEFIREWTSKIMFLDDEHLVLLTDDTYMVSEDNSPKTEGFLVVKNKQLWTEDLIYKIGEQVLAWLSLTLIDRRGNPVKKWTMNDAHFHGLRKPVLSYDDMNGEDIVYLYFSWDQNKVKVETLSKQTES